MIRSIKDKEIVIGLSWTLAAKIAVVALLGLVFFAPSDRPNLTDEDVARRMTDSSATLDARMPEKLP